MKDKRPVDIPVSYVDEFDELIDQGSQPLERGVLES